MEYVSLLINLPLFKKKKKKEREDKSNTYDLSV